MKRDGVCLPSIPRLCSPAEEEVREARKPLPQKVGEDDGRDYRGETGDNLACLKSDGAMLDDSPNDIQEDHVEQIDRE